MRVADDARDGGWLDGPYLGRRGIAYCLEGQFRLVVRNARADHRATHEAIRCQSRDRDDRLATRNRRSRLVGFVECLGPGSRIGKETSDGV